jgi:Fuc2NAc and GlcNAc transferase
MSNNILVYISAFFITIIGTRYYLKIAVSKHILSNTNYRTLHKSPVPRGGGIVFSLVFVFFSLFFWLNGQIDDDVFLMVCVGGGASSLFGFVDDIRDVSAIKKLMVQISLSTWAVFWLDIGGVGSIIYAPVSIVIVLAIFFLVWLMNAYNFMDGVDGMAIYGAVFSSGVIILVILITNGESKLAILFPLLLACSSAFMFFNWPPASIFMGDSGSIFLGYIFGVLILFTTMHNELSIWTWIIIFGYFVADTTVTQIARLIIVKKWYMAHRSHAYQNFARINDSHFKVTVGVVIYSLIWLLPLAIWSIVESDMAIFAAVIALTPALMFSYKYGPFLSST